VILAAIGTWMCAVGVSVAMLPLSGGMAWWQIAIAEAAAFTLIFLGVGMLMGGRSPRVHL
jgi:hypothetical protein